jgi:DNA-binding transcriptional MerR regulator
VDRDREAGLRSGELARRAGVSVDTLRAYERRGLLPPARRASNGYRLHAPEALERVEMIQAALAYGFTLSELGRFLEARRAGRPPCREVRAAARERLREIEDAIAELGELREGLARLVEDWDARVGEASPRQAVHLLESLPRPASLRRRAGAAVSARRFRRSPGRPLRKTQEEP